MCLVSKCFFCIPLNVGCLILGYLSAIIYGILCLAVSVVLVVVEVAVSKGKGALDEANTMVDFGHGYRVDYAPRATYYIPFGIAQSMFEALSAVLLIIFGPAFIFSAFLIHGVHKNRPAYVKAYFVYGVIVATLTGLAVILGFVTEIMEAAGIMLCILAVYIHCLMVVHSTYRGMQCGQILREPFPREMCIPNVYQP